MTDEQPSVVPTPPILGTPERIPIYRRWWFIALLGVILLLSFVGTCGDDPETGDSTTTTTVESTTTGADSPTTTEAPVTTAAPVAPATTIAALDPQFDTCEEATDAGYGPYTPDDPEFGWYVDGDGDGIVCEVE